MDWTAFGVVVVPVYVCNYVRLAVDKPINVCTPTHWNVCKHTDT